MKYNSQMIYNSKTKKWYKNGKGCGWLLKEQCECCGKKYFTRADKPSNFCSKSCHFFGKNNPMYNKTHTEKVRNKLRSILKNTTEKIKKKYGIDNISQLDSVKNKKGQTILSYDYIKNYVESYGYKLLDKDDRDNKLTMLQLQCPNGHIFNMRWQSFKKGKRCQECFYDSLRTKWDIDDLQEYIKYKKVVMSLTNKTYRKYKYLINPLNYKRGRSHNDYQLDHKFSILEGYKQNIDPKIISSYVNLEIIPTYENASKQDSCSISKEELLTLYSNII